MYVCVCCVVYVCVCVCARARVCACLRICLSSIPIRLKKRYAVHVYVVGRLLCNIDIGLYLVLCSHFLVCSISRRKEPF